MTSAEGPLKRLGNKKNQSCYANNTTEMCYRAEYLISFFNKNTGAIPKKQSIHSTRKVATQQPCRTITEKIPLEKYQSSQLTGDVSCSL